MVCDARRVTRTDDDRQEVLTEITQAIEHWALHSMAAYPNVED